MKKEREEKLLIHATVSSDWLFRSRTYRARHIEIEKNTPQKLINIKDFTVNNMI